MAAGTPNAPLQAELSSGWLLDLMKAASQGSTHHVICCAVTLDGSSLDGLESPSSFKFLPLLLVC